MLLFNNSFNGTREIQGFTKDEILEVKQKISQYKVPNEEEGNLDDYIEEIFRKNLQFTIGTENFDQYQSLIEKHTEKSGQ